MERSRQRPVAVELLGSPAIVVAGERRPVRRPREQAVLARLALAAPRPVTVEMLVDDVWGEDPPLAAVDAVRVHVSNLRKRFAGADRAPGHLLVTVPGGYRLADAVDVDVGRLDGAVRLAHVPALRELLDTPPWTGLAALDPGTGTFVAAARRIEERWVAGVELVAVADLEAGRADLAVEVLDAVTRAHPDREQAWTTLVRALTASGRRAEALRTCQAARQHLGHAGIHADAGLVDAELAALHGADPDAGHGAGPAVETGYVDVAGAKVAYAVLGAGPHELLFVHGGFVPFGTMRDEPRFARFLDRLARSFRVILLDRRGIGMSDPPAGDDGVTVEHWSDDLAAVLDASGAHRPLVYAHENAGPPALHLAAADPSRLAGLVLHSTAARGLRGPGYPFGPDAEAYERIDRLLARQWSEEELLGQVAPSVGRDETLLRWLERAGRLGAGPRRAAQLHRMCLEADVRHLLPRVAVPTVVLQPARRVRADPGHARYLAEHLPDAELELLDSGDHLPFLGDADRVIEAIERLRDRTVGGPVPSPAPLPPTGLAAILAVGANDVTPAELRTAGARTVADVEGALVATFRLRREAEALAGRLAGAGAAVVVEVDDTTGAADDAAVRRAAGRLA